MSERNEYQIRRTNISPQIPLVQQPSVQQQPQFPLPPAPPTSQNISITPEYIQSIVDELYDYGLVIENPKELIIKNYKEYILVKEARRREKLDIMDSIKLVVKKYKKNLF